VAFVLVFEREEATSGEKASEFEMVVELAQEVFGLGKIPMRRADVLASSFEGGEFTEPGTFATSIMVLTRQIEGLQQERQRDIEVAGATFEAAEDAKPVTFEAAFAQRTDGVEDAGIALASRIQSPKVFIEGCEVAKVDALRASIPRVSCQVQGFLEAMGGT